MAASTPVASSTMATLTNQTNETLSLLIAQLQATGGRVQLGPDAQIKIAAYHYYPMWFWVIIAVGFMFCIISCGVWFFCAICRLREEKPCRHPVYETHIVANEKDGEITHKSEKTKHSKKLDALNEAESLAKSFKSIRSKKSSKSVKSAKEDDGKSGKSKKSTKSGKSSKKESRKEGAGDVCVVQIDQ